MSSFLTSTIDDIRIRTFSKLWPTLAVLMIGEKPFLPTLFGFTKLGYKPGKTYTIDNRINTSGT